MERVLHVVAGMNSGGMESMIMNYYRNIDRSKIQFDFLIFTKGKAFYEEEITSLGGKIYKITSRRENPFRNYYEVKQFFRNSKYNIVHFHQGITYFYPLKMAKKYGVKHRIIHNHGINDKHRKYLKIYNELYAKKKICSLGTNYFSCSSKVLNHLFTKAIIENNKYNIINNSIDTDRFKYSEEDRIKIRNELGINNKCIVYCHVGTFTYPKNHEFLINVFKNINSKDKHTKLLLVGDGTLKEKIRQLVRENNLSDSVIFLGRREDVNKIMSASDIMLFPSLFEGLPLTLVEAQANGLITYISDNITKEVDVVDLIKRKSIYSVEKWNDCTAIANAGDRIKYNEIIEESKYNIKISAKDIEKIYLTMI